MAELDAIRDGLKAKEAACSPPLASHALDALLLQAVFAYEVFWLFVVSQQGIYEFVAYGHFSSFLKDGSFLPKDRLHKTSYTLICIRIFCTMQTCSTCINSAPKTSSV